VLDGGVVGLGVPHPGLRGLPGVPGDDGVLAGAEEPGPPAGAFDGAADRHPVLVREQGGRVRIVVSAAAAAFGVPAEPQRPPAAADPARERLAAAPGPLAAAVHARLAAPRLAAGQPGDEVTGLSIVWGKSCRCSPSFCSPWRRRWDT